MGLTATRFGKILTNGKILMVMVMVIILLMLMVMGFLRVILMSARLSLANQRTQPHADALITMATVSSTQSMPSGKTRSSGQMQTVMATATTPLFQAVTIAPMSLVNHTRTTDEAAPMRTLTDGLMWMMPSHTTPFNGLTPMATGGATTMRGSTKQ
jgi:Tfp pilus assembly protein PilX